ncbi:MAG: hypothetical protein ACRDDX_04950 [Cellulosilyticaceae bacterium]
MKYVVISPKNKCMCYDDAEQVAEYCMEKDNDYLDHYCKEQQLEYENMTPVEIGYAYTTIGAESRGCRVYETKEILQAMGSEAIELELIQEAKAFFEDRRRQHEVECPGYLEDIVVGVTPVPVSSLSGNVYSCKNIDGASEERGNSGI